MVYTPGMKRDREPTVSEQLTALGLPPDPDRPVELVGYEVVDSDLMTIDYFIERVAKLRARTPSGAK